LACAIDLVIVGVLIMAPPNSWASPTTSGSAATWPPSGQGLGRRYILVVFDDRPVGLLSHANGSGLFPEARSKLIALSWEEIRLALMLDIGSN
jgi:hypothetical protein